MTSRLVSRDSYKNYPRRQYILYHELATFGNTIMGPSPPPMGHKIDSDIGLGEYMGQRDTFDDVVAGGGGGGGHS